MNKNVKPQQQQQRPKMELLVDKLADESIDSVWVVGNSSSHRRATIVTRLETETGANVHKSFKCDKTVPGTWNGSDQRGESDADEEHQGTEVDASSVSTSPTNLIHKHNTCASPLLSSSVSIIPSTSWSTQPSPTSEIYAFEFRGPGGKGADLTLMSDRGTCVLRLLNRTTGGEIWEINRQHTQQLMKAPGPVAVCVMTQAGFVIDSDRWVLKVSVGVSGMAPTVERIADLQSNLNPDHLCTHGSDMMMTPITSAYRDDRGLSLRLLSGIAVDMQCHHRIYVCSPLARKVFVLEAVDPRRTRWVVASTWDGPQTNVPTQTQPTAPRSRQTKNKKRHISEAESAAEGVSTSDTDGSRNKQEKKQKKFLEPFGIAVCPHGNGLVYVSDRAARCVYVLDGATGMELQPSIGGSGSFTSSTSENEQDEGAASPTEQVSTESAVSTETLALPLHSGKHDDAAVSSTAVPSAVDGHQHQVEKQKGNQQQREVDVDDKEQEEEEEGLRCPGALALTNSHLLVVSQKATVSAVGCEQRTAVDNSINKSHTSFSTSRVEVCCRKTGVWVGASPCIPFVPLSLGPSGLLSGRGDSAVLCFLTAPAPSSSPSAPTLSRSPPSVSSPVSFTQQRSNPTVEAPASAHPDFLSSEEVALARAAAAQPQPQEQQVQQQYEVLVAQQQAHMQRMENVLFSEQERARRLEADLLYEKERVRQLELGIAQEREARMRVESHFAELYCCYTGNTPTGGTIATSDAATPSAAASASTQLPLHKTSTSATPMGFPPPLPAFPHTHTNNNRYQRQQHDSLSLPFSSLASYTNVIEPAALTANAPPLSSYSMNSNRTVESYVNSNNNNHQTAITGGINPANDSSVHTTDYMNELSVRSAHPMTTDGGSSGAARGTTTGTGGIAFATSPPALKKKISVRCTPGPRYTSPTLL